MGVVERARSLNRPRGWSGRHPLAADIALAACCAAVVLPWPLGALVDGAPNAGALPAWLRGAAVLALVTLPATVALRRTAAAAASLIGAACTVLLSVAAAVAAPDAPAMPLVVAALLGTVAGLWALASLRRARRASREAQADSASGAEAGGPPDPAREAGAKRPRSAGETRHGAVHPVAVRPSWDWGSDEEALEDAMRNPLPDPGPAPSEPSTVGDDLDAPFADALEDLVDSVRDTGLTVRVERSGTPVALSDAAEAAAFRLVREALTNVVRHADRPTRAQVALRWHPAGLTVSVVDDGRTRGTGPAGKGLLGLRDRVLALGGEFRAGPGTVRGFRVEARIPGVRVGQPTRGR